MLEGVQFPKVCAVVRVERDGEGAARAVAEVEPGGLGELGRERRIAARGLHVEAEEGLFGFSVVQFGDGGEHPGRHLSGPAARFGVHDRGAQPALRGPPRGDETDDPAAHDQDVGAF